MQGREVNDVGAGPAQSERGSRPPAVELRHLRYFLAVFDELHFGRAAEKLSMAQPPLSQAIRKLEGELGVQLFDRTSRAVAATEAGRVFAEEARKVLAYFDFAVAEVRRAGEATEALQIGCVPHLSIEQLLRFLGMLHERDPSSRAQITHIPSIEQVRRLRGGELDLGIIDHAEDYAELEMEPLFAGEQLWAFLPRGHRLAARENLGPEDLRKEDLVLFPREEDPALHDRLLALIQAEGYAFRAVHEASSMNGRDLLLAVAAGLGIAFGPLSLKEVGAAAPIVINRPLDPPPSLPDTMLAWRANPPRQLLAKRTVVLELARELRGAEPAS